jgi:hypothetical protein
MGDAQNGGVRKLVLKHALEESFRLLVQRRRGFVK